MHALLFLVSLPFARLATVMKRRRLRPMFRLALLCSAWLLVPVRGEDSTEEPPLATLSDMPELPTLTSSSATEVPSIPAQMGAGNRGVQAYQEQQSFTSSLEEALSSVAATMTAAAPWATSTTGMAPFSDGNDTVVVHSDVGITCVASWSCVCRAPRGAHLSSCQLRLSQQGRRVGRRGPDRLALGAHGDRRWLLHVLRVQGRVSQVGVLVIQSTCCADPSSCAGDGMQICASPENCPDRSRGRAGLTPFGRQTVRRGRRAVSLDVRASALLPSSYASSPRLLPVLAPAASVPAAATTRAGGMRTAPRTLSSRELILFDQEGGSHELTTSLQLPGLVCDAGPRVGRPHGSARQLALCASSQSP